MNTDEENFATKDDQNNLNEPKGAESIQNQIALYSLLIDQIQKYNTLIWGIPIGLMAVNLFAFEKFWEDGPKLLVLAIFNLVVLFAQYNMIQYQRTIISKTKNAEEELKKRF